MKLQINTKGSWRNVVEFDADRAAEVEGAAAALACALRHMAFRVVDDNGETRHLNGSGAFRPLHDRPAKPGIIGGLDRTTSGWIGQP